MLQISASIQNMSPSRNATGMGLETNGGDWREHLGLDRGRRGTACGKTSECKRGHRAGGIEERQGRTFVDPTTQLTVGLQPRHRNMTFAVLLVSHAHTTRCNKRTIENPLAHRRRSGSGDIDPAIWQRGKCGAESSSNENNSAGDQLVAASTNLNSRVAEIFAVAEQSTLGLERFVRRGSKIVELDIGGMPGTARLSEYRSRDSLPHARTERCGNAPMQKPGLIGVRRSKRQAQKATIGVNRRAFDSKSLTIRRLSEPLFHVPHAPTSELPGWIILASCPTIYSARYRSFDGSFKLI